MLALLLFTGCDTEADAATAHDAGVQSDASAADHYDLVERVDVGGYSLAIACTGAGLPTIVMEPGFSDSGDDWSRQLVFDIAEVSRVCVYDRAGLGLSDSRPDVTDSGKVADDLHALLQGAHIRPPLVLVGHSLGGMHIRVYAHDHPKDVVGVVLIDSSHPDQYVRARERLGADDWATMERSIATTFDDPSKEPVDWERSSDLVRKAGNLGDRPLRVLSHDPAIGSQCAGAGCLSSEGNRIWEDLWQELQMDLASLSSQSERVVATGSGHYIQDRDPRLVIEAIQQVVEAVKRE
jgi:pimeloyl-ACP methyl ester carboxylesterase